jgi:protocatechuate 3,4-dioxygenase alpha subunit
MSDADELVPTPSQTVGPFFHFAMTIDRSTRRVRPLAGDPISLVILVTDGDGEPVTDALVEVWQPATDEGGAGSEPMWAFGRAASGADGMCELQTVRPERGPDAARTQAPHINLCVFARGLLRQLHTRIYFADEPSLDTDPVLTLIPERRRRTLLATLDESRPNCWRFHIRLQGKDETVFFGI